MTMLIKQATIEARLWLRRRETVMFSLLLPVMFLGFFGALYGNNKVPSVSMQGHPVKYIDLLVPSYAVYAMMAVALGTVSANIANERYFGILKRLGGTPLPRATLISAKIIAAGLLAGAVIFVLVLVGDFGYHVAFKGNVLEIIPVLLVGLVTFTSIGITLGGILKAEAAVAAGSLVYLALSFLGGVFVPRYQFPASLRAFSQYLPSERMVHAMQAIWTQGDSLSAVGQDLLVMGIWTAGTIVVASRRFQWE